MPSGIIISNITGLILYDSALISGVDYSEDDDDENKFENESGDKEKFHVIVRRPNRR